MEAEAIYSDEGEDWGPASHDGAVPDSPPAIVEQLPLLDKGNAFSRRSTSYSQAICGPKRPIKRSGGVGPVVHQLPVTLENDILRPIQPCGVADLSSTMTMPRSSTFLEQVLVKERLVERQGCGMWLAGKLFDGQFERS